MTPDCFVCFMEENYSPEKRLDRAFIFERMGEFCDIENPNDFIPICLFHHLDALEIESRNQNEQAENK